jgi:hypothetical protein
MGTWQEDNLRRRTWREPGTFALRVIGIELLAVLLGRVGSGDNQDPVRLYAKATHGLEERIQVLSHAQLRIGDIPTLRLLLRRRNADILHSYEGELADRFERMVWVGMINPLQLSPRLRRSP